MKTAPTSRNASPAHSSASASIWTLPVLAVLAFAATLSWFAYDEYRSAIENEYRALESNARIGEALFSAEQVLARQAAVFELEAGGLVRLEAHLLFEARSAKAWRVPRQHEDAMAGAAQSQSELPPSTRKSESGPVSMPATALAWSPSGALARAMRAG